MSNITTNLYSASGGKASNGFCIDDNGTAWVNTNMLYPAVNIINAAFDGVPFTTVKSNQFVCAEWAKIEMMQAFHDDDKTLQVITKFFEVIEREKQKILEAYHANH